MIWYQLACGFNFQHSKPAIITCDQAKTYNESLIIEGVKPRISSTPTKKSSSKREIKNKKFLIEIQYGSN